MGLTVQEQKILCARTMDYRLRGPFVGQIENPLASLRRTLRRTYNAWATTPSEKFCVRTVEGWLARDDTVELERKRRDLLYKSGEAKKLASVQSKRSLRAKWTSEAVRLAVQAECVVSDVIDRIVARIAWQWPDVRDRHDADVVVFVGRVPEEHNCDEAKDGNENGRRPWDMAAKPGCNALAACLAKEGNDGQETGYRVEMAAHFILRGGKRNLNLL
jgi:hypothetical protein